MKKVFEKIKNKLRRHISIRRRVKFGLALRHRTKGYQILVGNGIEVGALHNPAKLPNRCGVVYADAMSTEEGVNLFPELNPAELVPVSIIVDLDITGLEAIGDNSYDFAIANHVIEHIANPINVIKELFRVIRPGGHLVISAPDKNFTYDEPRNLTTFEHLHSEYLDGVTQVADDHYYDLVLATLTKKELEDQNLVLEKMAEYRLRREHAHVWNSQTFKNFMLEAQKLLGVESALKFESLGDFNRMEYFSVWEKLA